MAQIHQLTAPPFSTHALQEIAVHACARYTLLYMKTWPLELGYQALTRMGFVRMLLGASRYGAAAELEGIWNANTERVYQADAGYASIARALGMLTGVQPLNAPCTRGDGVELLYRFMCR